MSNTNAGPIWVVVIIFLTIGIVIAIGRQGVHYREKHPVYTSGTITEIYAGAKGSRYVRYTFLVDTVRYEGRVSAMFCKECKDDCCTIGGKVRVRYAEGDPANNDLVH